MYACVCNAIPERAVHRAIAEGASTLETLRAQLGVGAGCGRCGEAIEALLAGRIGTSRPVEPVGYRPVISAA